MAYCNPHNCEYKEVDVSDAGLENDGEESLMVGLLKKSAPSASKCPAAVGRQQCRGGDCQAKRDIESSIAD